MSYEGYYQYLCENGHYWTMDCYSVSSSYEDEETCAICDSRIVWYNSVDLTNGSYEFDPKTGETDLSQRIDGYIELEAEKLSEWCTCSTCGNNHKTGPTIYKIPKKGGWVRKLRGDEWKRNR